MPSIASRNAILGHPNLFQVSEEPAIVTIQFGSSTNVIVSALTVDDQQVVDCSSLPLAVCGIHVLRFTASNSKNTIPVQWTYTVITEPEMLAQKSFDAALVDPSISADLRSELQSVPESSQWKSTILEELRKKYHQPEPRKRPRFQQKRPSGVRARSKDRLLEQLREPASSKSGPSSKSKRPRVVSPTCNIPIAGSKHARQCLLAAQRKSITEANKENETPKQ